MAFEPSGIPQERHKGNWACGKCGSKIDSLPFEPDPSRLSELLCLNCYRAKRQAYRR